MPVELSKLLAAAARETPEEKAAAMARFVEEHRRYVADIRQAVEDSSGQPGPGLHGWGDVPVAVIFAFAETVRSIEEEFGLTFTVHPPKLPRRRGTTLTDEEVWEYGSQFEQSEMSERGFARYRSEYSPSQVRRILKRYKELKAQV